MVNRWGSGVCAKGLSKNGPLDTLGPRQPLEALSFAPTSRDVLVSRAGVGRPMGARRHSGGGSAVRRTF